MKKRRLYRLWPALILAALLAAASCGRGGDSDGEASAGEETREAAVAMAKGYGPAAASDGRVKPYGEVFNDSNYVHYAAAEAIGIEPVGTLAQAYRTRRPIVKVESGEHYTVDRLTHSMPYLVPEAALLLEDIGKAFCDSVEAFGGDRRHRIIVTSLLRTPHSVKRLRRVNRNAVDSSTHVFGTTFDISWYNFDYPDSTNMINQEVLKETLAKVLLAQRNQGRCYVKYERKSPCFHITAR